jgi:cellulose synthase/poly-beta-1,6-N-acetylglucosamine synthase-like glycosyltransferase
MNQLFDFIFILLVVYLLVLSWFAAGFVLTQFFKNETPNQGVPLTIIICARNEEQHIAACLNSILKQNYDASKVQLIFINDASSDYTLPIATTILKKAPFNYRIISNKIQKGKKQSITYAMDFAAHELILLRDADTFTKSLNWLQSVTGFYLKTNSDLIIGPVAVSNHRVLLWALQAIENNILTVITCGSAYFKKAFLCNGANLIFKKEVFIKTKGFSSHIQYLSGDDVFFLEDVKKISGTKICYLKSPEALVYTYPVYSFGALMRQKIRWASKFKQNKNPINFGLGLLIFAVNAVWVFCFIESFSNAVYQSRAFVFVVIKLSIDILLLFLASRFIKNKNLLWFSLPAGCVYPFYSCVVAVLSLFIKPKWKV